MIANEYSPLIQTPTLSVQKGKTLRLIYKAMNEAILPFRKIVLKQDDLEKPLNENKYTQIFVEQVDVFLRQYPNIGVKNQYSDVFYNTKGVPDFYFHKIEEGRYNEPIIVWESKILNTHTKKERKKEYVVGNKNNGGIERFKTEKHGKGMCECGLLGFVENETFEHWHSQINEWIDALSNTDDNWYKDEKLHITKSHKDYCLLKSKVHRTNDELNLSHLWVATYEND